MGKLEYSDSARAAAQVASGVGFIGAGVVQARPNPKNGRQKGHGDDSLKGLTTAAAIWLVAGTLGGRRPGAGRVCRRVGAWRRGRVRQEAGR